MQYRNGTIQLSATDVANHSACRHLTALNALATMGERKAPSQYDTRLALLRERGRAHEEGYLDHLRMQGLEVLSLPRMDGDTAAIYATRKAMARGVDVIAQATLADNRWFGRPDVLRRIDRASELGCWSYEPYDTKLARVARGLTILQLCVYVDLLSKAQGLRPEMMHVVAPWCEFVPEHFRVDEYLAYFRRLRTVLQESVEAGQGTRTTYPAPVAHCDVCRWWAECNQRWHDDDHLSLVAGMGRVQEQELLGWGISTVAGFAALPLPLVRRPSRGSIAVFERLREQARAQLATREQGAPFWELLAPADGQGLARLPEPSPGDVFLDLEADPFWGEGGLEYLFGLVALEGDEEPRYVARWAKDREQERHAFESLMDELMVRLERHPGLHVFHFGHYDASALKRLAARHGTREDALDRLLRSQRLVDLLRVVRQGLRIGVESYSLKQLEPCYGFVRETPLEKARAALLSVETAIELGHLNELAAEDYTVVASYNHEDCLSTLRLRQWLEERRREATVAGALIRRPIAKDDAPSEKMSERQARVRSLAERLLSNIPAEAAERTPEQQGRYLLAHCLEFHHREEKVGWWEFFRLAGLSEQERAEEPRAIVGLAFERRLAIKGKARIPTDRYRIEPQEVDERYEQAWLDERTPFGTIERLSVLEGWVEIKKRNDTVDIHPRSVFLHDRRGKKEQEDSLERLAAWVAEHGLTGQGSYRAGRDLLLRERPRHLGGDKERDLRLTGEDLESAARRLVLTLDDGVLPIQGPPGAGKTYIGARMIVGLVKSGRKVGITATSHKVIQQLVKEAADAASEEGFTLRCIRKVGDDEKPEDHGPLQETNNNGAVSAALASGEVRVVAGTSWLWSRPELACTVDVLFVDEAGQMSLADVLAVSQAARSVVLIGDPQQLEQPIQGSHPEGTDVAALDHLLGKHETLPQDRGLFLEQTWRLHPEICAFTSEQFYERRLTSRPGLDRQTLQSPPTFEGAGLWFVPVAHQGNTSSSDEEVEIVASLVGGWLARGAEWTDAKGLRHPLQLDSVVIVTPYNAQIARLRRRLPDGRIGTVDKFQGQQAPVVIYSMATSSPEDAPRGMEFLYSRHRLNVATSRAMCACVVVASPRLLEPECKTPLQMRLANSLCRYAELARMVSQAACS
jgi:predicted RecB family nuclease